MRLLQRKIVAWLMLAMLGFNPLLEVLAVDMTTTAVCETVLAAGSDLTESSDEDSSFDCVQHQACISYCQFTPLQHADLLIMQVDQLFLLVLPDEPDNFQTHFLDGIKRPPRV